MFNFFSKEYYKFHVYKFDKGNKSNKLPLPAPKRSYRIKIFCKEPLVAGVWLALVYCALYHRWELRWNSPQILKGLVHGHNVAPRALPPRA